jgi:hypothetical protein
LGVTAVIYFPSAQTWLITTQPLIQPRRARVLDECRKRPEQRDGFLIGGPRGSQLWSELVVANHPGRDTRERKEVKVLLIDRRSDALNPGDMANRHHTIPARSAVMPL